MPNYLKKKIVAAKCTRPPSYGRTREGYSKTSGAPSGTMIRLEGETRWRRLMIWQTSNVGTAFVRIKGQAYIVPNHDIPACK